MDLINLILNLVGNLLSSGLSYWLEELLGTLESNSMGLNLCNAYVADSFYVI